MKCASTQQPHALLYKFTERIPENIQELHYILQAIAEKNTSIHPGSEDSDWPTLFRPTEDGGGMGKHYSTNGCS